MATDTGGSARVPASNCGIWGFRPSRGFVSVAGVNPLAPSFDTVGVLAQSADVLAKVGVVLLACPLIPAVTPGKIHLIEEAFALADKEVQQASSGPVRWLRGFYGDQVQESSLRDLVTDEVGSSFAGWADTFCVIQWAEINSCLGAWIAEAQPEFGPDVAASFQLAKQLDRRRIVDGLQQRERYFRSLHEFLGPDDLLCIPTTPALPPRKGHPPARRARGSGYYPRTSALASVAGLGRLPQVSLPIGNARGVPVGLSLLARHGRDALLLDVAMTISQQSSCV